MGLNQGFAIGSRCSWAQVPQPHAPHQQCNGSLYIGEFVMIEFVNSVAMVKGVMTWHAHTIRLPSCTVSLGPRAKLLAQETKAYTLVKPWDCILDRHIAMVSVFRSLAFCDSLGQMCTQDSALSDLPERRYRLPLHAPFI